jgi:hypothetical protein
LSDIGDLVAGLRTLRADFQAVDNAPEIGARTPLRDALATSPTPFGLARAAATDLSLCRPAPRAAFQALDLPGPARHLPLACWTSFR